MTTESFIRNLWYKPEEEDWITYYNPDTKKCVSWRLRWTLLNVKYGMKHLYRRDKVYEYHGTINNDQLVYESPGRGPQVLHPLPSCMKKELLLKWCVM